MKRKMTVLLAALVMICALLPQIVLPVRAAQGSYAGSNAAQEEWEVLRLTNQERYQAGLNPLTALSTLQAAGDIRAAELVTLFSHTRPDGTSCFTVLGEAGISRYGWVGENIAVGYTTPDSVMTGWMNSEGHRANILNANFVHMGVGYEKVSDTTYTHHWVQIFYTDFSCSYTAMELLLPESMTFAAGTTIDEMDITAVMTCKSCGDAYLPVLSEYCTGYDPTQLGAQTVTVSCLGYTATFQVTLTKPMTFTDVSTGDWFYDDVKYVYDRGLMNGTSETKFSPDATLTRGMVVTTLHRMEGVPAADYSGIFSDVPNDQWYTDAVEWAAKYEIVNGYPNGKFGPEDPVTREQLATILCRYAQYKGYSTSSSDSLDGCTDGIAVSSYATSAVQWAVAEDILLVDSGRLRPAENANRAEVAAAMASFCQAYVD